MNRSTTPTLLTAVTILLTIGCSEHKDRWPEAEPTLTSSTESPAPATGLQGFGASYEEFLAAHKLNSPDRAGNSFDGVLSDGNGTVVLTSHSTTIVTVHFERGTPLVAARRQVRTRLLPVDATIVRTATQDVCLTDLYRSRTVERALAGQRPVVSYFSSDGDAPFMPSTVVMAIVIPAAVDAQVPPC